MSEVILAQLLAQGAQGGADLVTLRAIAEEAGELGATRALTRLGLADAGATVDLAELRELLRTWRDAKRSAWKAAWAWVVRLASVLVLAGLALRLGGAAVSLRFQGHAAVFDRVDRAGDVFRAGAFAGAGLVPLLWQHRGMPVGSLSVVRENARGLWVEGAIEAAEAARLVRCGAVAGLSVGFRVIEQRQGARRALLRVALVEVSLVAVPMQALARVEVLGPQKFQQEKTTWM